MKLSTFLRASLWALFLVFAIKASTYAYDYYLYAFHSPDMIKALKDPLAIFHFAYLVVGAIATFYSAQQTTLSSRSWNIVNICICSLGIWTFSLPLSLLIIIPLKINDIFQMSGSSAIPIVLAVIGGIVSIYVFLLSLINICLPNNSMNKALQKPDQPANVTYIRGTSPGNFWLDILISLGIGLTIFMLLFLFKNGPLNLIINLIIVIAFIFLIISDIKSSTAKIAELSAQSQTRIKVAKRPYILTSISLLSTLIITLTYTSVCTGKFCSLVFMISIIPVLSAMILGIIYSLLSPYPRKRIIFSLLLFVTSLMLFLD